MCRVYSNVFLQPCHRVTSPELDDIQWNETATSDSMIVTLLFLLLSKKKPYTFHSHSKCVMISERAKRKRDGERGGGWMKREGTDCLHAHMQVFVSIVHAIRS